MVLLILAAPMTLLALSSCAPAPKPVTTSLPPPPEQSTVRCPGPPARCLTRTVCSYDRDRGCMACACKPVWDPDREDDERRHRRGITPR